MPKVAAPKLSMIAAMDRDRVIGIENSLPWRLPADMQWFVKNTKGKPVIVGRKTFESFGAKPLKGRPTVVVTRDPKYNANGGYAVNSVEEAIDLAAQHVDSSNEIMIIGGASFYQRLLPETERLYLTLVEAEVNGDARFPEYDPAQWREVFSEFHPADEKNEYAFTCKIFEKHEH